MGQVRARRTPGVHGRILKVALLEALVLFFALGGRGDSTDAGLERAAAQDAAARVAVPRPDEPPAVVSEPEIEDNRCESLIEHALASPALDGTPGLDAARGEVLLYAKAEPVIFTRTPVVPAHGTDAARTYRSLLATTSSPWSLVQRLWPVFSANPELGRAVLLREGYLYAEKPELSFALVDLVAAQLLFSDKQIWIHRGHRLLHAERAKTGHYVFLDGPERGERVKLLLFDRVGVGEPPAPLHRDFRPLRQKLGFDRVRLVHLGEHNIVADLRYGSTWVRTLLAARGAELERTCEIVKDDAARTVASVRATHARAERVLEPLRRAMVLGIEDALPFDEPRTEYGQQDGRLRGLWRNAYFSGKTKFEFQTDTYYVFNAAGKPLVPEVCVDYIFDTIERASGTWWRDRGEPRERVTGRTDFASILDEAERRRATGFIALAEKYPEHFDVLALSERERVPFKYPRRLADYLIREADQYRPGDVVLIRGYAPWDKPWQPKVQHTHSFFVYESDPVTGMPITLAGNPGRPLLQTWQFEAFRTPDRSIWTRVRPHLDWLEEALGTIDISAGSDLPARLAVERKDRPPVSDG